MIKTTLSLDLPRLPTIGTILAPDDPTRQTILNMIYKEPGELEDLLQTVFGCHYLEDCLPVQTQYEYNLAQLFDKDGEVYWDRKKQYSINCQVVCDCDKFITFFKTALPGLCGDGMVFKKVKISRKPHNYYDQGKFASDPFLAFIIVKLILTAKSIILLQRPAFGTNMQ